MGLICARATKPTNLRPRADLQLSYTSDPRMRCSRFSSFCNQDKKISLRLYDSFGFGFMTVSLKQL